jgi:hypothetical protein
MHLRNSSIDLDSYDPTKRRLRERQMEMAIECYKMIMAKTYISQTVRKGGLFQGKIHVDCIYMWRM